MLRHILRLRLITEGPGDEVQHGLLVPHHELLEGLAIPIADPHHQFRIRIHTFSHGMQQCKEHQLQGKVARNLSGGWSVAPR